MNESDKPKPNTEIQSFNEGDWELDLADVSIEALEQRLELAIGAAIMHPLTCPGTFLCNSAFGCGSYICANF